MIKNKLTRSSILFITLISIAQLAHSQQSILNVSYDVSRELYKEINPSFASYWKSKTGNDVIINQSHGGSSKQAGAVIAGLEADVITMNQAPDIDILFKNGNLVKKDWKKDFPNQASPYSTVTVFLVRKGNPKNIRTWSDLTKPGTQVIIPNPKTSGNGRYTYLAAYGFALQNTKDPKQAREFVRTLFENVPILDGGGRGATTTFTERDVGDVLVTFENEAALINKNISAGKFDVIYPTITIEAFAPVAIIQKVTQKRGTGDVAYAYLNFLYSETGQDLIAKHNFRPSKPSAAIKSKYESAFPKVKTFTVESLLGGWDKVQKDHFDDGAAYDQIIAENFKKKKQ